MSADYIIRRRPESFIVKPPSPSTVIRYCYSSALDRVVRTDADGGKLATSLGLSDLEHIVSDFPEKWEVYYDGRGLLPPDEQQDRRVTLHVTEVIMLDGEVISRDDALTLYNELREVLRET